MTTATPVRLTFAVNNSYFLTSHRLPLVLEARRRGWHCDVLVGPHEHQRDEVATSRLVDLGCSVTAIPLTRSGVGPRDLSTTITVLRAEFARLRPDIVHLVTPKLVVLGGIAARSARVKAVVFAISGLGFAFTGDGFRGRVRRAVARTALSVALRNSKQAVIVQNSDDEELMQTLVSHAGTPVVRVPGSGVDLDRYRPRSRPLETPVVVFPGRMLRSKGVVEFLEALRMLRLEGHTFHAVLAGDVDHGNPDSLDALTLARLASSAGAEWIGHQHDMTGVYGRATIACLPSYREGLPLALAEAAASGLAIVTTDVPGCRETVIQGETGLLVPARDAASLAEALRTLLANPILMHRFGANGRRFAERRFGVDQVVDAHFRLYSELLG